jgi:two-component system, sensor histidine kinase and response regulator
MEGARLLKQQLEQTLLCMSDGMASGDSVLHAVIENMAEAIFLVDNGGRLLLTNAGGKELIGGQCKQPPEDLRKLPNMYLTDGHTRCPEGKSPFAAALNDEVCSDVELYIKHEERGFWVSFNARPIKDAAGTISGAIIVGRDITARRRLEEQLRNVAEEAIASTKLKSEFVANVSHEIRTPLSGILGMAELLVLREESDEESREIAGYVLQSAQGLLEIVNDLLDFSKLEAGKLALSRDQFSVPAVLKEVSNSISLAAAKKGLAVTIICDPKIPETVSGDRGRLVQILLNFAHNALKFTTNGTISLRADLSSLSPDSARVRFSVLDTGIGIRPEIQKALFAPFVQGDGSMTRRYGGTGLGLSIAKKLTELMTGEIGLESEFGKGSEFWVAVPFGNVSIPDMKLL